MEDSHVNRKESHGKSAAFEEDEYMDFETILNDIYGNGLFHIILLILTSMTCFVTALEVETMIFMDHTPEYLCNDSFLSPGSTITWITKDEFLAITNLPNNETRFNSNLTTGTPKQCWGMLLKAGAAQAIPFACSKWSYKTSQMIHTVVTQFDLVCDRQFWIPLMQSSYLFFNAVGFVLAFVSDVYGRRIPFLLFSLWGIVISLVIPFAPSAPLLLVLRCCRGMSAALNYLGMNIISELAPVRRRAAYGNVFWVSWALGYMSTAGIAHLLQDWQTIRLWSCAFFLVYVSYPFIVFESPRWLCMRGRRTEAIAILQRIAKWNNAKIPPNYFTRVDNFLRLKMATYAQVANNNSVTCAENSNKNENVCSKDRGWDLLKYRELRLHTLVFCFVHSVITLVYFGIVTSDIFAIDNMFMNVFLMGLIELPTSFLAWASSVYLGRRFSVAVLLLLTGVSAIVAKFTSDLVPALHTTCALCSKLFLAVAYCVADLYITELYPTTIRSIGFFTVITVASVFSAIAPYVNYMSGLNAYLPSLFYGVVCVSAAILTYFCLPETRNCPLAQTVHDYIGFTRGNEQAWTEEMHRRHQELNKQLEITPEL